MSADILFSFSYLTVYMKLLVTLRSLISSSVLACQRWSHTHLDEHTLDNSSPLTLGIRGDFLSMYKDYTLNVLYICSEMYIFACILWSREMAISRARHKSFILKFHWGEKFPLTAKWVGCCIKKSTCSLLGPLGDSPELWGSVWGHSVVPSGSVGCAPDPDPGRGLCSRPWLGTELPLADLFLGTGAELLNKTLFFRLRDDRFDHTMKSASYSWYS